MAVLDEQLERKFRELAMKKFGYSKGSMRRAAEKAISAGSKEEREQSVRPHMLKEENIF